MLDIFKDVTEAEVAKLSTEQQVEYTRLKKLDAVIENFNAPIHRSLMLGSLRESKVKPMQHAAVDIPLIRDLHNQFIFNRCGNLMVVSSLSDIENVLKHFIAVCFRVRHELDARGFSDSWRFYDVSDDAFGLLRYLTHFNSETFTVDPEGLLVQPDWFHHPLTYTNAIVKGENHALYIMRHVVEMPDRTESDSEKILNLLVHSAFKDGIAYMEFAKTEEALDCIYHLADFCEWAIKVVGERDAPIFASLRDLLISTTLRFPEGDFTRGERINLDWPVKS